MIATPTAPAPVVETPQRTQGRSVEELLQTVSASRLQAWQTCRLKFWFRYVEGIQKPVSPALHVGSTVHSVLQAWNMARWRKEAVNPVKLKELFHENWNDQGNVIEWNGEEGVQRDLAWNLLETYFRETPIAPDEMPQGVEVSVEADLSSHGLPKLVGVIDLVRAGGRIVDFKTTARTPNPEDVSLMHETQSSCYALMYREATGEKESAIEFHHLVKLKTPKIVVTPLAPMTQEQEMKLMRIIASYVDGLDRRDVIPSPGLQCSFCEFANECRKWG